MLKLPAKSGWTGKWDSHPLASFDLSYDGSLWTEETDPLIWAHREAAQERKRPCVGAKLLLRDSAVLHFVHRQQGRPLPTAAVRIEGACSKKGPTTVPDKYRQTDRYALIKSEIGRHLVRGSNCWQPLANIFIQTNAHFIIFGPQFKQNLAWYSTLSPVSLRRTIWGKENCWFTIQIQEMVGN